MSDQFDFYKEQFKLHSQRILEYQKDRLKLVLLSVAGTAAFFGWIVANPPNLSGCTKFVFYGFPTALNILGLIYLRILNLIIDRHSGFLDFLESKVMAVTLPDWQGNSAWKKYRTDIDATRRWDKPINTVSYLYWLIMVAVSVFLGIRFAAGNP